VQHNPHGLPHQLYYQEDHFGSWQQGCLLQTAPQEQHNNSWRGYLPDDTKLQQEQTKQSCWQQRLPDRLAPPGAAKHLQTAPAARLTTLLTEANKTCSGQQVLLNWLAPEGATKRQLAWLLARRHQAPTGANKTKLLAQLAKQ
jgi:hypothetical protein